MEWTLDYSCCKRRDNSSNRGTATHTHNNNCISNTDIHRSRNDQEATPPLQAICCNSKRTIKFRLRKPKQHIDYKSNNTKRPSHKQQRVGRP
mmetsp:Transcript_34573/g.72443  ORF Transcript_34573/g.72443 Transcript_34573/m.72443 type:complete len:92 (-) Transcript_34573:2176-2451(-)